MTKLTSPLSSSPATDSLAIENAQLDWTDENHPRSVRFDDIYHSTEGACEESQHVFVGGTQLLSRWQQQRDQQTSYTVAEIGFGSGLNFLMTWKNWTLSKNKPRQLHFLGFEKYPLKKSDMAKLLARYPNLEEFSSRLLEQYSDHGKICHRMRLSHDVLLDLHFGDATTQLQSLDGTSSAGVDSWFLDGFSPNQNPLMWQQELVSTIAQQSRPNATLATYSAAGFFRRQLSGAGFKVEKIAGYGSKRHMTRAILDLANHGNPHGSFKPVEHKKPWFIQPKPDSLFGDAIVVGAGLSGCSVAYSLAKRGMNVVIVESSDSLASGASGIPQMALRPRLFKNDSALARFYLQGYLYSAALFPTLNECGSSCWHPTGVIQTASALHKKNPVPIDLYQSLYGDQVLEVLSAEQVQRLTGININEEALHFTHGGWVDPKNLCHTLIQNERISLLSNYSVAAIKPIPNASTKDGNSWQIRPTSNEQANLNGKIIVLANSHKASEFAQTKSLALQSVRGQATQVVGNQDLNLKQVLSGQRSLFPSSHSMHTLSASYRQGCDTDVCSHDDQDNLMALAREFPQLANLRAVESVVGVRCNSPDFTPIVGMAPAQAEMESEYADLKRDAGKQFKNPGHYHRGLYLSLAHGSNGLTTAPLAGEVLASMICAEVSPISQSTLCALSATRFLIRDLKKQKQK